MSKGSTDSPITDAIRAAVRAELVRLVDDGVIGGGQTIPRTLFSPEEYGYSIGMSGAKIRQLVKLGMPAVRVGAQLRIEPAAALVWLKTNGDYLSEAEASP